jgi:hypothetical protein
MDHQLRPGQKGEPLPEGEVVFRLGKTPKDFSIGSSRINPEAFELSSKDEKADIPSLTVWAERLTTREQALDFIESKREAVRCIIFLGVDQIRSLRPEPDSPDVLSLNVVWVPLVTEENGVIVPDRRPGAEGHAGIIGLVKRSGVNKWYYKSLRSQLADKATFELFPE